MLLRQGRLVYVSGGLVGCNSKMTWLHIKAHWILTVVKDCVGVIPGTHAHTRLQFNANQPSLMCTHCTELKTPATQRQPTTHMLYNAGNLAFAPAASLHPLNTLPAVQYCTADTVLLAALVLTLLHTHMMQHQCKTCDMVQAKHSRLLL